MNRDFELDKRDLEERESQPEQASRMRLSQGRGGGSDAEETRQRHADEALLASLRSVIDESAAGRPTVSEFIDRLEKRGVRPVASVQSSGRWNGILYEFSGERMKGSHLGRPYTAKGLQERRGVRYDPARDNQRLIKTSEVRDRYAGQMPARPGHEINLAPDRRQRDASGLSPAERTVLWDAGRFRAVPFSDLAQARYQGQTSLALRDVKHLAALGYIERRAIPVDGRGRSIEVIALTRQGRALIQRNRGEADDPSQAVYAGFVKPREIHHDASLYRMYQIEASRIEQEGGSVRRVVLDYELKKRVYSPLAKARQDLPPFEYAERQQEIAKENDLPVVDGHIVLPDMRLEYETPDGEERHIDLELATRNYRAAHIRSKASAGFRVYADARSGALSAVLDDHDVIAELLRM
jgi:DNA-binding MarR family transcriptional regulator